VPVAVAVLVCVGDGATGVRVAVEVIVGEGDCVAVGVGDDPAGGAPTPKAPVRLRASPTPEMRNPEEKKRLIGRKFTSI
jgi:hypothetical protein